MDDFEDFEDFEFMDGFGFPGDFPSLKDKAIELIKENANIYKYFYGVSHRHYSSQDSEEIKEKVKENATDTFANRSLIDIERDQKANINHEWIYQDIFCNEFRRIEFLHNQEDVFQKKQRENYKHFLINEYKNIIEKALINISWRDFKNSNNINDIIKIYFDDRNRDKILVDRAIEFERIDYYNAFKECLDTYERDLKEDRCHVIYLKYKNSVQKITKQSPYLEFKERNIVAQKAKLFFDSRTSTEILEDNNICFEESDYLKSCNLYWENKDSAEQDKIDNEIYNAEQDYHLNQGGNHHNEKYVQYGGPSDGYGGSVNDDFINDALGGDPDAILNID